MGFAADGKQEKEIEASTFTSERYASGETKGVAAFELARDRNLIVSILIRGRSGRGQTEQ